MGLKLVKKRFILSILLYNFMPYWHTCCLNRVLNKIQNWCLLLQVICKTNRSFQEFVNDSAPFNRQYLWQLCAAMMSRVRQWVELVFTKRFRVFLSYLQKIAKSFSVIPILLTFMYLVALNLLVNNQLNSLSNSTHHLGI